MSLVLRWLAAFFSGWVVILIGTTFSTEVAAADTYRICALCHYRRVHSCCCSVPLPADSGSVGHKYDH